MDQCWAPRPADSIGRRGIAANLELSRFARHCGFRIKVCRLRAKTKGKVERPIRYLRDSFLYGRTFVSDADLNDQATHWLATVANVRQHATTQWIPQERFLAVEQPVLQVLPACPYQSARSSTGAARGDGAAPDTARRRRAPIALDVRRAQRGR
jgi:hypothetical protein